MKPFPYRVVVEWSAEDRVFVARVPALPGCAAHGKTAASATQEVIRAATGILSVLRKDGDAAPPSDATTDYSGQFRVRLPRGLHEHLSRLAAAEGVSLNQELVTLLSGRSRYAGGPSIEIEAGERTSSFRAPRARDR